MRSGIGFFAVAYLMTWNQCHAQDENFEVTVSGQLASLLPDDTRLLFWNPIIEVKGGEYLLKDAPLSLPFEQFAGHQWHVEFWSDEDGRLFSVTLSPDLFDRPRRINILLNQPIPHIRLILGSSNTVMYFAPITQRMRYRDLPVWDANQGKFATLHAPVMKAVQVQDGIVVHDAEMESGCMAIRWCTYLDHRTVFRSGETDHFSVNYDSGGLFPEMETTFDFKYNPELHGY